MFQQVATISRLGAPEEEPRLRGVRATFVPQPVVRHPKNAGTPRTVNLGERQA
jgi:hypothetical protein